MQLIDEDLVMSPWTRAATPHDRTAAARTFVLVSVIGLGANVLWEVHAILDGSPTEPAALAGTLAVGTAAVAVAMACRRAPERVPVGVYAAFPLVAILFQIGVCLGSDDATTSGQVGFIYPVVYAAAHFRPLYSWCTAAAALVGDAVVVLSLLPIGEAVGDLIVMGSAVAMLTSVLVTAGIYQTRLAARLNALATVDPLTGLATRRELEAVADRLLAASAVDGTRRARRSTDDATAVGLVLIDIDRFKALNDAHGHPIGDAALVHVAQLVRATVRPSDTVARLGGDELAVLLPGPLDDAKFRAEMVCQTVRVNPLHVDDRPVRMTVSVGLAHAETKSATFAELYAAADAALYRAKVAGRDGFIASSDT